MLYLDKNVSYDEFLKIKKLIDLKKKLRGKILSNSMKPLIMAGEFIHISSAKERIENLKTFDVIVFWQNNQFISHFLWKKNTIKANKKSTYVTRSLQNIWDEDLPITESDILGVVDHIKIPPLTKMKIIFKNWISKK